MSNTENTWEVIEAAFQDEKELFLSSIQNPLQTQINLLKQIIKHNQNTEFGRACNFSEINNYEEFIRNVPLCEYTDIEHRINRIKNGENNVLTADKPILFEITSGSRATPKYIPYTNLSIRSFQRAVFPWLADLLVKRPGIKKGRIYFALSPISRKEEFTRSGVPIGMGDDSNYFGKTLAHHFSTLLITSDKLSKIKNYKLWKEETARILLEANDLSFISIWSPTFLLEILKEIGRQTNTQLQNLNTQALWPNLDTISCWMDASSASFANELKTMFPHVYLQGKGLLSTEAAITLPYSQKNFPILAINSNFYEFIDSENNIRTCNGLEYAKKYQVVVTNYSGLYRYNTKDIVELCGYYLDIPELKFIGRAGITSDMCGEKLTEEFVLNVFSCANEINGHAFLVPTKTTKPHYIAYIEEFDNKLDISATAEKLDQLLKRNPHYDYARNLGQLDTVEIIPVNGLINKYIQTQILNGRRLGDIKPPVLLNPTNME